MLITLNYSSSRLAAAQRKRSLICCAAPLNRLRVKGLAQVHLYDDNDKVIENMTDWYIWGAHSPDGKHSFFTFTTQM